MLKILIPINPVTKKNNPRIVKCGRYSKVLPSLTFVNYQKEVGKYLEGIKAPEGLLNIKAIYYRGSKHGVDLTNLHSALHDVLTHYNVIEDDSFKFVGGTDGSRIKFDSQDPRTEIEITILND